MAQPRRRTRGHSHHFPQLLGLMQRFPSRRMETSDRQPIQCRSTFPAPHVDMAAPTVHYRNLADLGVMPVGGGHRPGFSRP